MIFITFKFPSITNSLRVFMKGCWILSNVFPLSIDTFM